MCERSNRPAACRTAWCSAVSLAQRSGICLGCSPEDVTCEWYAVTMELLTEDEITAELAATPGWDRAGAEITREVHRADFRDALLYLGAVAYLAEQANHHPDVAISW